MARRGRPPKVPAETTVPEGQPPLSPVSTAYEQLFPGDQTKVSCQLCQALVPDVAAHLIRDHPKIELADYLAQYPGSLLRGEPPEEKSDQRLSVSSAEAGTHPGGREGAFVEKSLDRGERRAYREDVQTLIDQNYPPSYQVASIAYQMVLARRVRLSIEQVREKTQGNVWGGENLKLLADIDSRIASGLKDLDRAKSLRDAGQDALRVVEEELAEAEAWVQAHQGEFVERCGGCGQILTPPALPHWAFAPLETDHGREWMVWSPELWKLVLDRTIPLWVMAWALRTSPEGLKLTAKRRGEPWPDWIVMEAEERELRKLLDAQDQELALLPRAGNANASPPGPIMDPPENGQPDIGGDSDA